MMDYKRLVQHLCPPLMFGLIVRRTVNRALDGDDKAIAWLSKYLLDEPYSPQLMASTGLMPAYTDAELSELVGLIHEVDTLDEEA